MTKQCTRIFFYKKPVYKKPRTSYPQITPNLRNFKNYKKTRHFDLRNSLINNIMVNKHVTALYDDWHTGIITWYNTKPDEYRVVFPDKSEDYFKLDNFNGVDVILEE